MTAAPPADGATRALESITRTGIPFTVVTHGPVASLFEAAHVRGVEPRDVVKTLVVRRADDDFRLVLVPGDRTLSWPKLRSVLGASRLSMPHGDVAYAVTGYRPGTITPFGSTTSWPVIADASMTGRTVSVGGGVSGTAFMLAADDLVTALAATVADVTEAAG